MAAFPFGFLGIPCGLFYADASNEYCPCDKCDKPSTTSLCGMPMSKLAHHLQIFKTQIIWTVMFHSNAMYAEKTCLILTV
jgi:hypothetical protein